MFVERQRQEELEKLRISQTRKASDKDAESKIDANLGNNSNGIINQREYGSEFTNTFTSLDDNRERNKTRTGSQYKLSKIDREESMNGKLLPLNNNLL